VELPAPLNIWMWAPASLAPVTVSGSRSRAQTAASSSGHSAVRIDERCRVEQPRRQRVGQVQISLLA